MLLPRVWPRTLQNNLWIMHITHCDRYYSVISKMIVICQSLSITLHCDGQLFSHLQDDCDLSVTINQVHTSKDTVWKLCNISHLHTQVHTPKDTVWKLCTIQWSPIWLWFTSHHQSSAHFEGHNVKIVQYPVISKVIVICQSHSNAHFEGHNVKIWGYKVKTARKVKG